MKIDNLTYKSNIYTSNVYLLTGSWNSLDDLNTLIDVGRDSSIIEKIENASTGVGKRRVEQVFLTHNHYDHASLLSVIKKKYNPKIYAYSSNIKHVDVLLKGGEFLKIADRQFEVIHTPCHSNDSICLYCEQDKAIFAGDTPLIIRTSDTTYEADFLNALEYIATKQIDTIYFGHGEPLKTNCEKTIQESLMNAKKIL